MNLKQKIVHTYTFGCKVNLFDTLSIERSLEKNGNAKVDHSHEATPDTVVVNTCTVTNSADLQANRLIRKLHRQFPETEIIVTGCSVEHRSEEIQKIKGVSRIVPITEQYKLPQVLGWTDETDHEYIPVYSRRVRANLKMQNGCNAYCSFCILPYIRGKSTSIPLENILQQAEFYSNEGHHELVLTGTHIGAYGRDFSPRMRFSEALKAILAKVPNVYLRISSLEPTTLTPDVIRLVKEEERIRPHFHIPLQSGSDTVLKRMNRKYKSVHFRERIEKLFQTRDGISIGTDVIVGYPGETETEFQETRDLLAELPISYLHVFPFSARPGTKANTLRDDVDIMTKKRRVKILRDLSQTKTTAFFQKFLSDQQKIIVEKKRDENGLLCGVTPQHIPVHFAGTDRLMEREVDVKLLKIQKNRQSEHYVLGEMI